MGKKDYDIEYDNGRGKKKRKKHRRGNRFLGFVMLLFVALIVLFLWKGGIFGGFGYPDSIKDVIKDLENDNKDDTQNNTYVTATPAPTSAPTATPVPTATPTPAPKETVVQIIIEGAKYYYNGEETTGIEDVETRLDATLSEYDIVSAELIDVQGYNYAFEEMKVLLKKKNITWTEK